MADEQDVFQLRQKIAEKTTELETLKEKLKEKEMKKRGAKTTETLTNIEIARYSRQLILPEIGVKGQVKMRESSVLVVGAGGLGCPAALYLAAAGIGCIGLVDYDTVEMSNLHRQILHSEVKVDVPKVLSAKQALNEFNSLVTVIQHHTKLDSSNALEIINKYDIIVDATDNVATRYLLSDASILCDKPLVSGSALRFEGQLTVYHHAGGPCYRCLFPIPPPPETVGNCSDNGVLGAVPGVIGTLQAIEVIKIICGITSSFSQKMLIYDALEGRFLNVKLRPRKPSCLACGDSPTILQLQDYEQFCGASATDKTKTLEILRSTSRVTVKEYKDILDSKTPHILLDVREPVELEICSLPNALNIPLRHISSRDELDTLYNTITSQSQQPVHVFVVCKQGNDSQKAVNILLKTFRVEDESRQECTDDNNEPLQNHQKIAVNKTFRIQDIKGGLVAWAKHIDDDFPVY